MTDRQNQPDAFSSSDLKTEPVWDLPVRLFHWALVAAIATGWSLGYWRSFSNIGWHFYVGYAVGGLLVFRLLWGFIGNSAARLSALFWSPRATLNYVAQLPQRKPSGVRGHSPIGSLSVMALIASIATQVVTGLGSEDDGLFASGPLAEYLSPSMVLRMTEIHYYNSRILLGLIAMHLLAIVFYHVWKRENLVTAMITGRKAVKEGSEHA